jgi:hypothetical protein
VRISVAYFLDSDAYRPLADASIASLRAVMPTAVVYHLTNQRFEPLAGSDVVLRGDLDDLPFYGRWCAQRDLLQGDTLFADCDTIFKEDVSHVFDRAFDIALPHIASPVVNHDGGIVFCRQGGAAFWSVLQTTQPAVGESTVEEQVRTFNAVAQDFPGHLHILDGAKYSYVPRNAADPCTGAAIVHYRGPRKAWTGLWA